MHMYIYRSTVVQEEGMECWNEDGMIGMDWDGWGWIGMEYHSIVGGRGGWL